jgi:carboxyl-terminal processing protease
MPALPPLRRPAVQIAAALMVLALCGCNNAGAQPGAASGEPDLGQFRAVLRQVERNYVEPISQQQLVDDAMKGMLGRLDPHSDYMDEQQYRQMAALTRGRFGGIGIELTLEGRVPAVIAPIDGTPAAKAGLEPGDRIVRIDGLATSGMDVEEIVRRLRGAPGTNVVLTIARTGKPPFDVPLTRQIIHVQSVKAELKRNRIGYVRISTFAETTPSELAAGIARLKHQSHGHLNGFVLDLRNDPGGLLDAAVEVAGDFLDGGVVVTTHGRSNDDDHAYRASESGDLIPGVPMAVLVNSASASASEIVAGALQDHHRATVIGTRSFGKGSVQSIIPLDGHGALRLTTALYYTPSGRSIQGRGIDPDIVVDLPKDEQVANTLVTFESDLYGALKNGGSLSGDKVLPPASAALRPEESNERPIKPLLIGTNNDAQLGAALDYLQRAAHREAPTHHG